MSALLRVLGFLVVAVLTLLSAWVGSSLASWLGGPRWLAIACALLLSPGLALWWERSAVLRRRARAKKRRVSLPATLALRSAVLSFLFLGLMVAWWPNQLFLALAQRGDWFLDGASADWDVLRPVTRGGAELLEGAWRRTIPDPYKPWRQPPPKLEEPPRAATVSRAPVDTQPVARRWPRAEMVDAGTQAAPDAGSVPLKRELLCALLEDGQKVCVEAEDPPEPAPAVVPLPPERTVVVPTPGGQVPVNIPPKRPDPDRPSRADWTWPFPSSVHPAASSTMPAEETSVEVLARALASRSSAGVDRLKAVHDWIATHIAYDAAAYQQKKIPGQLPAEVLARRTAVCAGYAFLFQDLARAAGEDVVLLDGQARGMNGFEGHAWNAARLKDGWALIDVTWNAGFVTRTEPDWTFVPNYRTQYFLMPPDAFVQTHLPTDSRWQLLERPRTAADVLSAPLFFAGWSTSGLRLGRPRTAMSEVTPGTYEAHVENPLGRKLHAQTCLGPRCNDCGGGGTGAERFSCLLDGRGEWQLKLFSAGDVREAKLELVMLATLQAR